MAIGTPWVGPVVAGAVAGSNVTTVTLDYSAAPDNAVVWAFVGVSDTQTALATPSGWNLYNQLDQARSHGAIYWRVKMAGDTTVVVNWTTAGRVQGFCASWPGVDIFNPAEAWGTYARSSNGTSYPVTATSTAAGTKAVTFSLNRGTVAGIAWTPDAALTTRLAVVNTVSAFLSAHLADGPATAGAHTYTHTSSVSTSNGLTTLFFLREATAGAPVTVTPVAMVSNEAFGTVAVVTTAPGAVTPPSVGSAEAFGTVTVTQGAAPIYTPGQVLNIGSAEGQNHFSVQVAPTGGGSWVAHSQAEIEAGYEENPYFYVIQGSAGVPARVQFWARMDAPKLGSSYSRSELREVNANGTSMIFPALTGVHELHGISTITHLPPNKPELVIAQLHDGDADRIAIRTQLISGQAKLVVRINGNAVLPRLMEPYVIGTEFEWKIRTSNGTAYVYFNDMDNPIITSTELVETTHPAGWYFKAGLYNQSNETLDAPDEYGAVQLRNLTTFHSETIPSNPTVVPEGITTGAAFGTLTATVLAPAGNVTANPAGIATAAAFGTPTAATTVTVAPAGIASAEAFGSLTVAATVTASPAGIASAGAVGTPAVSTQLTAAPAGIASGQVFGTASISGTLSVLPAGIASAGAFGTPAATLQGGPVAVSPASIPSGEVIGSVTVTGTLTVTAGGIPAGEAFGTPAAAAPVPGTLVTPASIPSAGAFGTVSAGAVLAVAAVGIPSAGAFGTVSAGAVLAVMPAGIASAGALGTPTILLSTSVAPAGIPGAEAFGSATVSGGDVVVHFRLHGSLPARSYSATTLDQRWEGSLG